MLSMNQLSKVYSEQYVLLKGLTKQLPNHKPDIFVNNVLPQFSNAIKPVDFDVERLVTLAVKKKTFFNDIQLAFDKHDSVIQLFLDYQNNRNGLEKYLKIEALNLNNNSAVIEFDLSDSKAITHFVTTENLLRTLILHLNENINDCRKLLTEISDFGDQKYKTEYKFLKTPKFPSYINNLENINIGDLPPFKKAKKPE